MARRKPSRVAKKAKRMRVRLQKKQARQRIRLVQKIGRLRVKEQVKGLKKGMRKIGKRR